MKKKRFKWIIACALALVVLTAFFACGQVPQDADNQSAQDQQDSQSAGADGQDQSQQGAGKALVVYFSATGNTETVAGYIAGALEADTFEIVPAEPYTADDLNWSDENSRVSREHEDTSLRAVELSSAAVENWDDYDTVFIGYPIWWGVAAWPTDSFVGANDFSGKTVIPFCTSSSSGLGDSGTLLAETAGTGEWQAGQRFSSGASEADVTEWLKGLGFIQ